MPIALLSDRWLCESVGFGLEDVSLPAQRQFQPRLPLAGQMGRPQVQARTQRPVLLDLAVAGAERPSLHPDADALALDAVVDRLEVTEDRTDRGQERGFRYVAQARGHR